MMLKRIAFLSKPVIADAVLASVLQCLSMLLPPYLCKDDGSIATYVATLAGRNRMGRSAE